MVGLGFGLSLLAWEIAVPQNFLQSRSAMPRLRDSLRHFLKLIWTERTGEMDEIYCHACCCIFLSVNAVLFPSPGDVP